MDKQELKRLNHLVTLLTNFYNQPFDNIDTAMGFAKKMLSEMYPIEEALKTKITQLSRMVDESETAENQFRKNVERLELRESIMVDALAEIKATNDGGSEQSIEDILKGCIEELGAVEQTLKEKL